ncbi:MAG: hypothetical protein ACLPND_08465 [Candidatus Korobacteraceae bacterium]|jgi:hypothetical protein
MALSLRIFCLLIFFSLVPFSSTLAHSQAQSPATVTFTLDFPKSQPEYCSIRVQSDGTGHYESNGRLSADADENSSFNLDFVLAPGTRQKIFELTAKAGYFQKDVDSHHKGIAFTGKKTLSYQDAERSGQSTYNYSSIAAVQELTSLMQGLESTLEFGRRLQYAYHYQKLALEEELKRMEDSSRSHRLVEVTAIQPILEQIIADPSVINVSRARAKRLLDAAGAN